MESGYGDTTWFGRPAGWYRDQFAIVDEPFHDGQIASLGAVARLADSISEIARLVHRGFQGSGHSPCERR